MLIKGFYTVGEVLAEEPQSKIISIRINKQHKIFSGHFPDNPIVPGVCMLQIIKEVTEQKLRQKLFLENIKNLKFLAKINPFINPDLILKVDIKPLVNNKVKVVSHCKFASTKAVTFSGVFRKVISLSGVA